MTGGTTTQSGSYQSGVSYSPVVSGSGVVSSGSITTGASGGDIGGSSTGTTTKVDATIPAGLMLMNLNQLQYLPWSCSATVSCNIGVVSGSATIGYSSKLI